MSAFFSRERLVNCAWCTTMFSLMVLAVFAVIYGFFVLAGVVAANAQAQTAEELFERALRMERTSGDYASAIEAYRAVYEHPAASRELEADALLRIGLAYENLGRTEAKATYELLLAEYGEIEKLAQAAREGIQRTGDAGSAANIESVEPHLVDLNLPDQMLYQGMWKASLTPDGSHILIVDWSNPLENGRFDLAQVDVVTGSKTPVNALKEGWQFATGGYISPDESKMAVELFRELPSGMGEYGLWIRDLRTGFDRELFTEEFIWDAGTQFWSSDSRHIYISFGEGETYDAIETGVYRIDVETGQKETVFRVPGIRVPMCISEDDRFITVSESPVSMIWDAQPIRIDLVTGNEYRIPKAGMSVYWVACDSEFIYGISSSLGQEALYRWPNTSDAEAGSQEFVMPVQGYLNAHGNPTKSGDFFVSRFNTRQTRIASVDVRSGELTGKVEPVGMYWSIMNYGWSQDGSKSIQHHLGGIAWEIRDWTKNDSWIIHIDYGVKNDGNPNTIAWFPDNERLLVHDGSFRDETASDSLAVVDVRTGEIITELGVHIFLDVVDNENILVETRPDADTSCFHRMNLDGVVSQPIHCGEYYQFGTLPTFQADVSNDGTEMVSVVQKIIDSDTLRTVLHTRLETGATEEVYEIKRNSFSISWPQMLPDKSGAILGYSTLPDFTNSLRKLDFESGQLSPWFVNSSQFEHFQSWYLHPHGDKIMFSSAPANFQDGAFLLRNVNK